MRKNAFLLAFMTGLFVCMVGLRAGAQDDKEATKASGEHPVTAYHLDFSINELEDGKKINTRHYSMDLATQNGFGSDEIKIGSRVPTQVEDGKFEYLDIGTSISVRMSSPPVAGSTTINVQAEISGFADADQAKAGHPLIRQVRLSGSTIVVPDKLLIIGSADDPNSKRAFQLTVTATKVGP
jgi:hypothetical protein